MNRQQRLRKLNPAHWGERHSRGSALTLLEVPWVTSVQTNGNQLKREAILSFMLLRTEKNEFPEGIQIFGKQRMLQMASKSGQKQINVQMDTLVAAKPSTERHLNNSNKYSYW